MNIDHVSRGRTSVCLTLVALFLYSCGGDLATTPETPEPPDNTRTPTSIAFTTPPPTLDQWGDTITLVANVLDQSGNAMSDHSVSFTSPDSEVAQVTSAGKVTTWKAGTVTVTASAVELSATLEVTVAVQRNPECTVPGTPATPGPVGGIGSWTEPEVVPLSVKSIITAMTIPLDVNDDGRIDIVMSGQNPLNRETYSHIVIVLNEVGSYRDATDEMLLDGVSPLIGPRDYALWDIDGDGRLDVYVANSGFDPGGIEGLDCSNVVCDGAPNAVIITQPGEGLRNTATTTLSPNPTRGFTHSVDLADVDCDGDPDAFEGRWPNGDAPEPSMLRINMEGTFVETTDRVTGLLTNEAVAGSAFCDLDRDGDPDLLVAMAPGPLRVFTNDGFGYFRALPDSTMPHPRSPLEENIYSDVNCADLDQDGWIDVIVHDHSFNNHYGKWQVFRNRGDMVFEEWSHILPDPEEPYLFPTGGGTSMVYDFNNDGWPDLLTGNSTNPLRILWNNGNGFTEQTLQGRWGDVRGSAPAVADLDGDGRLDIWMSMGGKDKETGEDPESWVIYQR